MRIRRGALCASAFVGKVTFDLKLSFRLVGSPPPSTEGGGFSVVALNVGRGFTPAESKVLFPPYLYEYDNYL